MEVSAMQVIISRVIKLIVMCTVYVCIMYVMYLLQIMNILCKYEYIKSISDHEEIGEQLKVVINEAAKTIQSLLIQAPPLVMDCSISEDRVTKQSTLFYSYKGESARTGDYALIRKEVLAHTSPGDYSQTSSLRNSISKEFNHEVKSNSSHFRCFFNTLNPSIKF